MSQIQNVKWQRAVFSDYFEKIIKTYNTLAQLKTIFRSLKMIKSKTIAQF